MAGNHIYNSRREAGSHSSLFRIIHEFLKVIEK